MTLKEQLYSLSLHELDFLGEVITAGYVKADTEELKHILYDLLIEIVKAKAIKENIVKISEEL